MHASRRLALLVLLSLLALDLQAAIPVAAEATAVGPEGRASHPAVQQDVWNETPWRDVAIPGPVTHRNYIDYSDVGVLINDLSADSREIGWAFVAARAIPAERVFVFDMAGTPTSATITQAQFDTFFAEPLRVMLTQRGNVEQLNFLVSSKGVPLRVSGANCFDYYSDCAAFDQEIALVGGPHESYIHGSGRYYHQFWEDYNGLEAFERAEYGFSLVTRLTGYDVATALALIDKADESLGERGLTVLDIATNRGWNAASYGAGNLWMAAANTTLNGTMGLPVEYDNTSTFITDRSDVMMYYSWGSNDGSWGQNWLPNGGFEAAGATSEEAVEWETQAPSNDSLGAGAQWEWARQNETSEYGSWSMRANLSAVPADSQNLSASLTQDYLISSELGAHAWLLTGGANRSGWLNGSVDFTVDALDAAGQVLSSNTSATITLTDSHARLSGGGLRFRPAGEATTLRISVDFSAAGDTANGSLYVDGLSLKAIRPHFEWENGSIAETIVSTGGRSFTWRASYGQSLVADLLEDGVSGVKGYVYEPYLDVMSQAQIMLPTYAKGYTMAESYYYSNNFLSWMGTVVGDPKMSPYSDRLQDVNIVAVRALDVLTADRAGVVQVVVENRGLSEAQGTLYIRDVTNGNAVIGEVILDIPPADQPGSRLRLNISVVPTSIGLVELSVGWTRYWASVDERVVSNNQLSLEVDINAAPHTYDLECTVSVVERGEDYFCIARIEDDGWVVNATLGWRVRDMHTGNASDWVWPTVMPMDTGFAIWWTFPFDAPLGILEIGVESFDDLDVSSGLVIFENVAEVRGAHSEWRGIHVEGLDDLDWDGLGDLSVVAPGRLLRPFTVMVRACVLDADFVLDPVFPEFYSSQGVLSEVGAEEEIDGPLNCFTAEWSVAVGSPTASAELTLKAENQVIANRLVNFYADSDGDGADDADDVFPDDPYESEDSDGDGVGDNADDYPDDANRTELEPEPEPEPDSNGSVGSVCTTGGIQPSADGCNTCYCSNDQWSCTERACAAPGEPIVEEEQPGLIPGFGIFAGLAALAFAALRVHRGSDRTPRRWRGP